MLKKWLLFWIVIDKVSKVIYPTLKNDSKARDKYFTKNLFGNLIGFHLKDGYEACKNFINNLQLFFIM